MGQRGPKGRGGRRRTIRFPDEHYAKYEEAAAAAGMAFSDYCAQVLAQAHELPLSGYLKEEQQKQQEEAQRDQLRLDISA